MNIKIVIYILFIILIGCGEGVVGSLKNLPTKNTNTDMKITQGRQDDKSNKHEEECRAKFKYPSNIYGTCLLLEVNNSGLSISDMRDKELPPVETDFDLQQIKDKAKETGQILIYRNVSNEIFNSVLLKTVGDSAFKTDYSPYYNVPSNVNIECTDLGDSYMHMGDTFRDNIYSKRYMTKYGFSSTCSDVDFSKHSYTGNKTFIVLINAKVKQ